MTKTPTLNIKELSLLKTNPKEFYTKKLEKDLEGRTVKHPINKRAFYRGSQVEVTLDEETELYHYKYPDGTDLVIDMLDMPVSITDGKGFDASLEDNDKVYDALAKVQPSLKLSDDDYSRADDYERMRRENAYAINKYHKGDLSKEGMLKAINKHRKDKWDTPEEAEKYHEDITPEEFDEMEQTYNKIVSNSNIGDAGMDLMTVKKADISEADLNRRVVADKGYNEAYVTEAGLVDNGGLVYSTVPEARGTLNEFNLLHERRGDWLVITKYPAGDRQGKGTSNMIFEPGAEGTTASIINPPYQKFAKDIIDEKHKIIIQHAYDPEYNDGNPYTD